MSLKRNFAVSAAVRFATLITGGLLVLGCATRPPPPAPFDSTAKSQLGEQSPKTLLRLGDSFVRAGNLGGARPFYEQAMALDPTNPAPLVRIGDLFLLTRQWQEAASKYRSALVLQPTDRDARLGIAKVLLRQGSPSEALIELDQLSPDDFDTPEVLVVRGVALDVLGLHDQAQVIYARGLDQAPQDFGLSRSLALSFGVTEDYATAVELLRPFSNDAERLTSARRALSYIYALSGQQDAAETVLASVSTEEELAVSRPFLNRLAELSNKDQAFAVFLDRLPPTQTNEFAKPLPESVPVSNVPKTEPVASSPETRIKPDTASLPQADQWGSHGVQIAAYRQLDKLEIGAQRLATQSSLFDPTDLAVETVQTDENGSLYRLILHGFDGFDAATAQCARIKQSGADCSIRALAGRRLRRLDDVVGTAD